MTGAALQEAAFPGRVTEAPVPHPSFPVPSTCLVSSGVMSLASVPPLSSAPSTEGEGASWVRGCSRHLFFPLVHLQTPCALNSSVAAPGCWDTPLASLPFIQHKPAQSVQNSENNVMVTFGLGHNPIPSGPCCSPALSPELAPESLRLLAEHNVNIRVFSGALPGSRDGTLITALSTQKPWAVKGLHSHSQLRSVMLC